MIKKPRRVSVFFGENKGTQIFDKQKSAGRLIKISCRNLIKSQPMRALATHELMKNLIQRLQKKRPNREFLQRSRICQYRND